MCVIIILELEETGDVQMPIYYYKLMDQLNRRGLKKIDLMEMAKFSNATMAKLTNNRVVQTDVLERICDALDCQIEDIMEYAREAQEKHKDTQEQSTEKTDEG